MLYKNGYNLTPELVKFIKKSNQLFIFSAYIKLDALEYLIGKCKTVQSICVRWEPRDLIVGVSDLEIYPYLKERNITLYRNPRLHLKAFIDDYNDCLMGSANISNRALNISESNLYNYELATIVSNLTSEDILYFKKIEQDSILITDNIYNQIKEQLPLKRETFPNEWDFKINFDAPDKHFLISSLPMSYDTKTLLNIYEKRDTSDKVKLNCAMHDLALYDLPLGLPSEILISGLKDKFFNHTFIKAFLMNLEERSEIYFGAAKKWIHKNCSDVPLPRKWEITENIQILFRWIVELGDGKYSVDQPNFAQRLFCN